MPNNLPEHIDGIDNVLKRLQTSEFRRRFRLGEREQATLARRGRALIHLHARDFVARRLAPAEPLNDGRQTPWRGHPVFVAQHATATCCRSCLARWHGIEAGRSLSGKEQAHVVAIIERWIERQRSDATARFPEQGSLPL